MRFYKVPDKLLAEYLAGTRREPGVRYVTGIPKGKTYPAVSQRQRERAARKALRVAGPALDVVTI